MATSTKGFQVALMRLDEKRFSVFFPYKQKQPQRQGCKSLIYIRYLVGDAGFEPATPAV